MAPKINAPVEGFTGIVAGVTFADGVGETDNENALAYFERQGYGIGKADAKSVDTTPATPSKKWKVEDIEKWASEQDPAIDVSAGSTKDDKLALIEKALEERKAPPAPTGEPATPVDGAGAGSQE